VNYLKRVADGLKSTLESLKTDQASPELITAVNSYLDSWNIWDKAMVQRRSQAYDDVENFENKFTAEYLFLMNATSGSIPRVNQSSIDRQIELDAQWVGLSATANQFINTDLPKLNTLLWEAGYGAIPKN